MTISDLSNYFREVASRHISLVHVALPESKQTFFALNTDRNADEFIRTREMDTILVLLPPDMKIVPPTAENYNWDMHIAFMALHRCPDNVASKINEAQNLTQVIVTDVCAQLLADRDSVIYGLQEDSFMLEPVGPIAECHYGYICMFTLVDAASAYPDPVRLPAR